MNLNVNLTKREREVLELLAQGLTLAEAADAMGVSQKTAGTHSYRLYAKIGVHDRTRLAHYALHHGIVANVFAEATKTRRDWTKGGGVPVLVWKSDGDAVVVYRPAERSPAAMGGSAFAGSALFETKRS